MVDEPKTAQDEATTSGGNQGTSQGKYTDADVEKLVSDRLAKAGRDAKALADKEAKLKRDAEELEAWRREREKSEEERIKDNPDALDLYRTRKQLKEQQEQLKREREQLDAEKAEIQTISQRAQEQARKLFIGDLATKHGIDAKLLDKPYLKSQEELEDYAKTIAQVKPQKSAQESGKPDSGIANAKGGTPTTEQIEKMTPEQYATWRLKTLDPNRKT